MGKIKIQEIAKKLETNSKEILEIAKKIGVIAKTSSSSVEEDDAKKIESNFKRKGKKEEIKTTGQVIIRREVIVNEDDKKNNNVVRNSTKVGIGFNETRNKDFNIVYREKPLKPMTVNELFGIKSKAEPKTKKVETQKIEEKKDDKVEESNSTNAIVSKEEKKASVENADKTIVNNAKKEIENNVEIKENSATISNQSAETKILNNQSLNNQTVNNQNSNSQNTNNNQSKENYNKNYNNQSRDNYNRNSNNQNRDGYNKSSNYQNRDNNRTYNNRNSYDNRNSNYVNRDNNQRSNYTNRDGFSNRNNTNRDGFVSRNNNYNNGSREGFSNRNANGYNSENRGFQGRNNFQNHNNFENRDNNFQRSGNNFGSNNGFKKDFRKPMGGFGGPRQGKDEAEKIETIEKDNRRDYSTKIIDKQKANRNIDDNKRGVKARKGFEEEGFDEDKLRDLKQVDRLSNMFEDQEGGMLDYYDLSTARGKRNKRRIRKDEDRNKQKIFELKEITIPATISVKDLATELKKTSAEVVKKLFDLGIMANINQDLDFDTAYLVADSLGIVAVQKDEVKDEDILFDDSEDKEENLIARPPVVVVMGHVDHGKTSLLDAIRNTNVIEGEAGGITQHIGAYKVTINGREITFLDTPGHEAFTSMRARGAKITDIAILVVAADDGVMPQTIEAINHAKAAGIPIVVAVNKIDLPGANVDKVKQELMKYELVPEEWGGDTIFVPISAKKNINIDNLLEMLLLVADMQNLRANPNRQSKGTVIEARLD